MGVAIFFHAGAAIAREEAQEVDAGLVPILPVPPFPEPTPELKDPPPPESEPPPRWDPIIRDDRPWEVDPEGEEAPVPLEVPDRPFEGVEVLETEVEALREVLGPLGSADTGMPEVEEPFDDEVDSDLAFGLEPDLLEKAGSRHASDDGEEPPGLTRLTRRGLERDTTSGEGLAREGDEPSTGSRGDFADWRAPFRSAKEVLDSRMDEAKRRVSGYAQDALDTGRDAVDFAARAATPASCGR